ncbi:MAG: bifunctional GNAT family N-acetyltransferase/ATP-binding protein [Acidimicrobiia bacterium]|jgi:transitional endoplasmic reticulum ATPase
MKPVIRDLLASDIGAAVRLLEECRILPDTKPADIAQFVSDVSSGAPGVVAVLDERIIGVVQARTVSDDAWINVVMIDASWRHQGLGSAMLQRLEDKLLHLGVRKISALLSSSQAGETALLNRGFTCTHDLLLYEKLEPLAPTSMRIVDQYGGEILSAELWDRVAGMFEEKKIIAGRVVAPLADPSTASQVGVKAPATVLLFGPPGTGKTTFAKAIAGRLGWPFIELLPSKLESGAESMSAELRSAMNELLQLDHAVVFIDEFDEIASAREHQPAAKGVVNELLKMIPAYRSTPGHLLVCATNFVGDIDSAVLRPGRFDLVIPIGPPDLSARRSLWEAALAHLDQRGADIEKLAMKTDGYTPGDIELAAQRAAAVAFDRIREGAEPAYISPDDLDAAVARTRASVSPAIRERFAEEVERFARI